MEEEWAGETGRMRKEEEGDGAEGFKEESEGTKSVISESVEEV